MINKHKEVFERMYQKYQGISEREGSEGKGILDVARDFVPFFKKEDIGALGIAHHFAEYIRVKERQN